MKFVGVAVEGSWGLFGEAAETVCSHYAKRNWEECGATPRVAY